ncbi:MAG TPA: hypothetical protein VL361_03635 [Candidatus Limnocylindrales bacterium]|jgi:hypothetical protein|nr:hypothetical protein [Candidatus Limnocylindrales bacterium]
MSRMRSLGKPEVLRSAAIAAFFTCVACYPRLCLAPRLAYPVWYLAALLFLGSIVLWAFVFAWHTQYTGQPVVTVRIAHIPFLWATASGLTLASVLRLWLDPVLRARNPDDFPLTFEQWAAVTLFSLAFTQLFLVFAPFAWALRLARRQSVAVVLTVLFGLYVLAVKNYRSPGPVSTQLWSGLFLVRLIISLGSVLFFIRGGLLLVWWWGFLLQSRHLLTLVHGTL